jgi:hypothetical protein
MVGEVSILSCNNKRNILSIVHKELYKELKEEFNLPSRIAQDCNRNAISIYKGWYNNPNKGRFPRVYKPTVWLTPKLSYTVNFEKMLVKISKIGEFKSDKSYRFDEYRFNKFPPSLC